MINNRFTSVII